MKKEEIYVVIDSEEKRLRAIEILTDAKESIYKFSDMLEVYTTPFLLSFSKAEWCIILRIDDEINISLDQLEQLLSPKQGYICPQTKIQCDDECCVSAEDCHITSSLDSGIVDCEPKQEIKMELDALKLIAESYGFELVEKKREIKVGDFGKFWVKYEENPLFGFLRDTVCGYTDSMGRIWDNFRHLTDEEKQQIQENW
jgi:hypothetical protein